MIRPVAEALEYIPDVSVDILSIGAYELAQLVDSGCDRASHLREACERRSGRILVRASTNALFPSERPPSCICGALFDTRECFDSLRVAFFLH